MNAYQDLQSSGIQWPNPMSGMLYQGLQGASRHREPQHGTAIFEDLDKQMSDFVAQREAVLREVRKYFVLPADSSVPNFFTEHRAIPQILLGAAPQLKACFGAGTVFSLRAPIDESGSRTLYAVAMWPGKMRDVRN